MSQAAALYVAANEFAEEASTASAHHYYLGVRDAFEAVMRTCQEIPHDEPISVFANRVLADDDGTLLEEARTVLRARRRASVAETLAVM